MRSLTVRFVLTICVVTTFVISAIGQNKAFDVSRMDTSTEACTDFFQYANGSWLKNTQIPASESRWGTFNILADDNNSILKDILENAAKTTNSPTGSDTQLIGDYYATCLDENAIEQAGLTPLQPYFQQIDGIKDVKDLENQIAMFHNMGVGVVFGFGGSPDAKNSKINIAGARQGGLTLPNKDYYTKNDAKSVETRIKFTLHMINMFKLLGDSEDKAIENAITVLAIQTRLAEASKAPAELRNPEASYNKKTLAQLSDLTPNFSWTNYMKTRGVPAVQEVNIGQPDFFVEVNKMMTDVSINQWKTYLRWMLVNSSAANLPKAFAEENFNFFGK